MLRGVDEFSDLFGEIAVSEFTSCGVGLAIDLLHGKSVDMNVLDFVFLTCALEDRHCGGFA